MPGRRRRSLGRLTAISAAVVVAVLVLAGVTIGIAIGRLGDAIELQTRRYGPAALQAGNALIALVDQETAVRGFAITGDESYLQPYEDGRPAEVNAVAALRTLLPAGATGLQSDVDTAVAAADRWRAEFADPLIAATRLQQPDRIADLLNPRSAPDGKQLFDAVRSAFRTLLDTVSAERSRAVDRVDASQQVLVVASSVAAVMVAGGTALVVVGVRRRVLAPVSRLARESRLVAGGEYDHRVVGGGPAEIDDLALDVEAMRRQIVAELAAAEAARAEADRNAESLARSNADLEQFAYVASHDLQEPLRKVSNFCQLLERQYGTELDDRAKQYIHFAVDGAKRMQVLINDLLSFSRVGRNADSFSPVPLAEVLAEACDNLAGPITESGATVETAGELPTVCGDRTLLVTLLQNVVGNAVKYRAEDPPRVVVAADHRPDRDGLVVSVEDNGIGIDPQYEQRIFVIFQRLHLRDSYGGTGIGLAMCKKIVEFHGGTIWLEPPDHPGSRFCFTLPEGTPA